MASIFGNIGKAAKPKNPEKTISEYEVNKAKALKNQVKLLEDLSKKGPKFSSMTDKKGNLLPQFVMGDANPWLQMQIAQQDLRTRADLRNATRQGLGQAAAAETALAARGGMDSGARERLALMRV